jgi:pectate lyase
MRIKLLMGALALVFAGSAFAQASACVAGATISGKVVDCGGKTIGLSCKGDSEKQPAVLTLNNATVKNVRLSKSGGSDGIHCTGGTCVLENVVWEDICEDAASIGNGMKGVTMVIKGGSAFNSTASTSPGGKPDKIFQNNGRNTTIDVQNFTALGEHGKLARSCGDCTDNGGPRYFKFTNVTVNAKVGSIVGVNRNYGDKATIRGMKIKDYKEGSTVVCEEYKGVEKGSGTSTKFKPASGSSWWGTAYCDVKKTDVSKL